MLWDICICYRWAAVSLDHTTSVVECVVVLSVFYGMRFLCTRYARVVD